MPAYYSRSVPAPREDLLSPKVLQRLQMVRAKWYGQRINWPDWTAQSVQQRAAHDTMRERRAA